MAWNNNTNLSFLINLETARRLSFEIQLVERNREESIVFENAKGVAHRRPTFFE